MLKAHALHEGPLKPRFESRLSQLQVQRSATELSAIPQCSTTELSCYPIMLYHRAIPLSHNALPLSYLTIP